jgi:hypothetical protein
MMQSPEILERTADLPEEHRLQAQFALAAFGTLKARNITYVSVPITSGPQLYAFMDKYGFKSQAEAKQDRATFLREVIEPNMARGIAGSAYWTEKLPGSAVIAPAEFDGRLYRLWGTGVHWGPDDFMGMWVPLIDEKVTNMAMLNGWEYSNGCGEEYLQAVLMQMGRRPRSNITIMDGEEGRPVPLDEGLSLMAGAFKDILSRGIEPRNMAETLAILLEAEDRFYWEKTGGKIIEPAATSPTGLEPGKAAPSMPPYDHDKIRTIAKEIQPLLEQHFPDILPKLKTTSSYDFSPLNAIFRQKVKPLEPATAVTPPPYPVPQSKPVH